MTREEFIKSHDFMQLGHAIETESWQSAAMIASRMQKNAVECKMDEFIRPLLMIKQCIASRKKKEALNALATLTSKRVAIINSELTAGTDTDIKISRVQTSQK